VAKLLNKTLNSAKRDPEYRRLEKRVQKASDEAASLAYQNRIGDRVAKQALVYERAVAKI